MTSYPEQGSATTEIAATPEAVWALIADVTRMGEWSPECREAEWSEGCSGPGADARFLGHNQAGDFKWSVPCTITECVEGKVFAFYAGDGSARSTTWRFELEPSAGGTRLTESFDAPMINIEGSPSNFEGRYEMLVAGAQTTIANIKAAAERS
jgi:uncharacterized protein YndB with AHSA1/START domain